MLDVKCPERLEAARKFADEVKLRESLESALRFLDNYASHGEYGQTKCVLYPDFAPHSFGFEMHTRKDEGEYRWWFSGAVVFHGPHDGFGSGSAPTFCCSLTPEQGWQVHT